MKLLKKYIFIIQPHLSLDDRPVRKGRIIDPISQMLKGRLREVKQLTQSHTARTVWCQDPRGPPPVWPVQRSLPPLHAALGSQVAPDGCILRRPAASPIPTCGIWIPKGVGIHNMGEACGERSALGAGPPGVG